MDSGSSHKDAPTIPPALSAFVGAYVVKETAVTLSGQVTPLVGVAADRCLLVFSAVNQATAVLLSTQNNAVSGQGFSLTASIGNLALTSHHDPGLVWSAWYAQGPVNQVVTVFEVFYRP